MKKIILFLTVLFIAFSCEKDKVENIDKGKLDPNATIVLRPAKGVQLRSTIAGLTALEIVEQATSIKMQMKYFDDMDVGEWRDAARGFNEATMKDFEIPALKMLAIDVINAQGEYIRDFTTAKSIFITDVSGDTLAYVPDEVLISAKPLIEAAFTNEDYNEVYRIFNEAFTFLPIE